MNDVMKMSDGWVAAHLVELVAKKRAKAQDFRVFRSMADYYVRRGMLTQGQLGFLRKKLADYPSLRTEGLKELPMKTERESMAIQTPKGKSVVVEGDSYVVSFPYDPDLVTQVKALSPRRKFDGATRTWTLPASDSVRKGLLALGFAVPESPKQRAMEIAKMPGIAVPTRNGRPLRRYQEQAVAFIETNDGRCMITDEQGVGKTVEALAWLAHRTTYPALVVCPNPVKWQWAEEAREWFGITSTVLSGKTPRQLAGALSQLTIINYDILSDWKDALIEAGFKAVVYDECHKMKNRKAKRTVAGIAIGKRVKHVLPMSGTPIVNRPSEFFTMLNLLKPEKFSSFWRYAEEFCDLKQTRFGWDYNGASNLDELNRIIRPFMLRRLKSEVNTELPAKQRIIVPVSLNGGMRLYERVRDGFLEWLAEKNGPEAALRAAYAETITKLMHLRRMAAKLKMETAMEWINDYLEDNQKLVVYAVHHEVVDMIMEMADKAGLSPVRFSGRETDRQKQEAKRLFIEDPSCRLFVANVDAVTGLDGLQKVASDTLFLEMSDVPGVQDQAEDRVHRVGQKAESITAYYILASGTVEVPLYKAVDKKRSIISQALNGRAAGDGFELVQMVMRDLLGG